MAAKKAPAPSTKPLWQRLLVKPGKRLLVVGAPGGYSTILGTLPDGAVLVHKPGVRADVVQVFVTQQEELRARVAELDPHIDPHTVFWVSYPKNKQRGTDLNRDVAAALLDPLGYVAVAIVSVDDTWAAMRYRRA